MTITATETPASDNVIAWREWVLLTAGYQDHDAELLAQQRHVDLHTAVYLAEAGCPTDTALRILL